MAAAVALALASLASNVTTMGQLSAEANTLLAVRSTISRLVNAGVVWGGLPILSGWLVRRSLQAAVAGIAACLTALFVHYGVGRLLGLFDAEVWTENEYWFGLAVVVGAPLGLVGAAARRNDTWGLLARLALPIGAVLEPFYLGMFTVPAMMPWPGRVSSVVTGVVLVAAGTAAGAAVLVRHRRRQPAREAGTRS